MIVARDHKLPSRLNPDRSASSRTSPFTKASGMPRREHATAMENWLQLTDPFIKVTGGTTRSTEKGGESSPTATSTRANGVTTNFMAKESTSTLMGPLTPANGKKTNSTAMGSRLGPMAQDLRVNMPPAKSKELENLIGLTPVSTRAHFRVMSFMGKASIGGQTAEFITETG